RLQPRLRCTCTSPQRPSRAAPRVACRWFIEGKHIARTILGNIGRVGANPPACLSGVFSVKNDFCSCDMSHSLACASGVIIPGVGHTPPVERAPVGASKLHPASHSGVLFLSRFAPPREEYRL